MNIDETNKKLAEEEEELQKQLKTAQQRINLLKEKQNKLNEKKRKADTHMKCELAGIMLASAFGEGFNKTLNEEELQAFSEALNKQHTSKADGSTCTLAEMLLKETKKLVKEQASKPAGEEITIDMPHSKTAEQTSFDTDHANNNFTEKGIEIYIYINVCVICIISWINSVSATHAIEQIKEKP